jgi:hypothetical protein
LVLKGIKVWKILTIELKSVVNICSNIYGIVYCGCRLNNLCWNQGRNRVLMKWAAGLFWGALAVIDALCAIPRLRGIKSCRLVRRA